MTCLVDIILSGAWMKLHSFMLGTFFVYTLALSNKYTNFQEKKTLRRFLEKMSKLFIVKSRQTKKAANIFVIYGLEFRFYCYHENLILVKNSQFPANFYVIYGLEFGFLSLSGL